MTPFLTTVTLWTLRLFARANCNPSARSPELIPCASGDDADQAIVGHSMSVWEL